MRDINEAVLKSPFNEQLSVMANHFGVLLRAIVDTIDRRGLQTRYLRKHKREVRFSTMRLIARYSPMMPPSPSGSDLSKTRKSLHVSGLQ